jgi:hypothetical protein
MLGRNVFITLLAWGLCVCGLSAVGRADDAQTHEGIVVSAGTGKLTMTDNSGKQHSHEIKETVKITVNGKPGKLEDLKAGVRIQVMTDKDGTVLAVSTVDKEK